MSANALHLNLLNPHERRSSSPIRARILLPIAAGICLGFVLLWGGLIGIQLLFVSIQGNSVRSDIAAIEGEHMAFEALKARYHNLLAESEQFAYYINGRTTHGNLLKNLAYAVPEGVTLTALSLPPPPDQNLRPPPGSKLPPLQGPTETSEHVEMRLTGLAQTEQDVFQLMQALKGAAFTNDVVIVEKASVPGEESPRVLDFRQETLPDSNGQRGVFFNLAYTLKPRNFVK